MARSWAREYGIDRRRKYERPRRPTAFTNVRWARFQSLGISGQATVGDGGRALGALRAQQAGACAGALWHWSSRPPRASTPPAPGASRSGHAKRDPEEPPDPLWWATWGRRLRCQRVQRVVSDPSKRHGLGYQQLGVSPREARLAGPRSRIKPLLNLRHEGASRRRRLRWQIVQGFVKHASEQLRFRQRES